MCYGMQLMTHYLGGK
ncbi:hypothetical protein PO124_25840 [Bacillus licheniformis]|nr:hypothetical protein [Bacillus licheniformis]